MHFSNSSRAYPISKSVRLSLAGLLVSAFAVANGLAQAVPTMVKDLNPTPQDINGSLAAFGDTVYLSGHDLAKGEELWKSNGTEAGTSFFLDLCPGYESSAPSQFTAVGKTVFFAADYSNSENGAEPKMNLWKTDGTSAGTRKLREFNDSDGRASNLRNFFAWGKHLFFTAESHSGASLFKSDGTSSGTVGLKTLLHVPYTANTSVSAMQPAGGRLYFTVAFQADATSGALWKTDGSPAGTSPLRKDLFYAPASLTTLGETLYFTAIERKTGKRKLWKTDGSKAGTIKVVNMNLGDGEKPQLIRMGKQIFFTKTLPGNDHGLWKTDGTAANTKLVKKGFFGSLATYQPPGRKRALYLAGRDVDHGTELWKSDGTAQGTHLLKDLTPGTGNSHPTGMTVVGGRMYFRAGHDSDGGNVLWTSLGTPDTTRELKTFKDPLFFYPSSGKTLYFAADDGISGREFWKTDGTPAGTVLLKDLRGTKNSYYPSGSMTIGSNLYFNATNETQNPVLHVTDGTSAGTKALPFIQTYARPSHFCRVGEHFYFAKAEKNLDSDSDVELWRSDGSPEGTALVKNIRAGGSSNPRNFVPVGNLLYFTTTIDSPGQTTTHSAFCRSDGTAEGTIQLTELGAIEGYEFRRDHLKNYVNVGSVLYFIAEFFSYSQLWRSDGTAAGTLMLMQSSGMSGLSVVGDAAFFLSSEPGQQFLYKSDGTVAGTVKIAGPYRYLESGGLKTLPGRSNIGYFLRRGENESVDLCRTDGTTEGTYQVHSVTGASNFVYLNSIVVVGDSLLYGVERINRRELWSSDGSTEGTKLVREGGYDISADSTAGNSSYFLVLGSIWKTDGTPQGTGPVWISLPGTIDYHNDFRVAGDKLYFHLMTKDYGRELFSVPLADLKVEPQGLPAGKSAQPLSGNSLGTPIDDGISNLLKFAFFIDGSQAGSMTMTPGTGTHGLPAFSVSTKPGGQKILRLEYIQRKNSGLVYRPMFSNTLAAGSFEPMTETPTVTPIDEERDRVVIEHEVDPNHSGQCFGTVEVTQE
jgi:ELWxxDGT repeat protein